MSEVSPEAMLAQYRAHSDDFTREQARLFGMMPPAKQRELLFWMTMHSALMMGMMKGAKQ